ncbi:MAG: hypothetical protein K6F33_14240, partial [Bacteroidales bacterium]|nr:hypothetical protein [Bacteroidales bacterium]
MQTGIYEQIINQLFEEKLSAIDRNRFYVGERSIEKHEVAKLLSMYLTNIFQQVLYEPDFDSDDEDDSNSQNSVSKRIKLANAIIRKLVAEFKLETGNIVSAQAKILTAVIDKTKSDYPDLAKRLQEIMPIKGLVNGALFTGKGIKLYTELQKEIAS